MDFIQVIVKVLLGAIVLVVYTRVTGRSQVTPLSSTDVVSSIVIGSLISESIFDDNVPVWAVLAVVAIWTALFMGIRVLKARHVKAELLLDGKTVQLVKDGRLIAKQFSALNLTLRDFATLLHEQSIPSMNDLENVWFEPNGKLSVQKKGEPFHATLLVEDGQVYQEHLQHLGKDYSWLLDKLNAEGHDDEHTVFCAEWHDNRLWVYPY